MAARDEGMDVFRDPFLTDDANPEKEEKESWSQWINNRMTKSMIVKAVLLIVLGFFIWNACRKSSENGKEISVLKEQIENLHQSLDDLSRPSSFMTKEIKPTSQFNAANYLFGATVDTKHSAESNLSPYFGLIGRDQNNFVILDRKESPLDELWCTSDKKKYLTIDLSMPVKPVAVSYQHTKWNGSVPIGAPKRYDVHLCFPEKDDECYYMKVLATNCQYNSDPDSTQEQNCTFPEHVKNIQSVSKIRFEFRENHGNVKETCVSLVRFYGEAENAPELHNNEDLAHCSKFRNYFYNHKISYFLSEKDCMTLYSLGCCGDCPQCCAECEIVDWNWKIVSKLIFIMVIAIISVPFLVIVIRKCLFPLLKCYRPM